MPHHVLKCHPYAFQAMFDGRKRFEFRYDRDRKFLEHDVLHLFEWDPDTDEYSGRELNVFVTYLLRGPYYGIPEGFAVLSVSKALPVSSHSIFYGMVAGLAALTFGGREAAGNAVIYALHGINPETDKPCVPPCDGEYCGGCAMVECAYREPLHRHHDGCPACWTPHWWGPGAF
jgi:hypothetical protein